jgi:hypothetical protein
MHPKSISRELAQETTIVLALPDFDRQRLSGIRRGWCRPGHETGRVIRSDSGDAHRLSLSARVLSTTIAQVKAKAAAAEALLTSAKTMVEHPIWVLPMRAAIRPICIVRARDPSESNLGSASDRGGQCDGLAVLEEDPREASAK